MSISRNNKTLFARIVRACCSHRHNYAATMSDRGDMQRSAPGQVGESWCLQVGCADTHCRQEWPRHPHPTALTSVSTHLLDLSLSSSCPRHRSSIHLTALPQTVSRVHHSSLHSFRGAFPTLLAPSTCSPLVITADCRYSCL